MTPAARPTPVPLFAVATGGKKPLGPLPRRAQGKSPTRLYCRAMWLMVAFQWFLDFSAVLTALVVWERYFRRR